MRRVVVTGIGIINPTGNSQKDAWQNTVNGVSGIDKITLFDTSSLSVSIAGEVKNFNPENYMDVKEARRSSRFVQFAIAAGKDVMTDAGLLENMGNRDRFGTSVGVGLGSLMDIELSSQALREKGSKRVSPFFIPYTIPNMAAGMISISYNLRGPNICPTTACASGTHGVGEAFMYISQNLADVMVCGGVEAAISPVGVTGFANLKALSSRNDDPKHASRPFDLDRDGFVIGEGAGLLVLEELEHAKKRGAKIYAEMVGYGMSADANHITAPAPGGEGGERCMRLCLESGKIPIDQLDYINAHGTSTKLNDAYESAAIGRIFKDRAKEVSISSTKGVTGHCLGAAGGIEAVYTVLSVFHKTIPPTANYQTQDPECVLDYTPNHAREKKIRYAISNSFGFGGTNATIAFKSFN